MTYTPPREVLAHISETITEQDIRRIVRDELGQVDLIDAVRQALPSVMLRLHGESEAWHLGALSGQQDDGRGRDPDLRLAKVERDPLPALHLLDDLDEPGVGLIGLNRDAKRLESVLERQEHDDSAVLRELESPDETSVEASGRRGAESDLQGEAERQ